MKPQLVLKVYLDEDGYQADIFINGKEEFSQCRDFGSEPPADLGLCAFTNIVLKGIEEFRLLARARARTNEPP